MEVFVALSAELYRNCFLVQFAGVREEGGRGEEGKRGSMQGAGRVEGEDSGIFTEVELLLMLNTREAGDEAYHDLVNFPLAFWSTLWLGRN